jgi:hypothetical protein
MGLNVFMLFTGFGVGSYLFGEALRHGASHFCGCTIARSSHRRSIVPLRDNCFAEAKRWDFRSMKFGGFSICEAKAKKPAAA